MPPIKILILSSTFLPTVGGLQYEMKWFLDNLDRRLTERGDIETHFAYPDDISEPYSRFRNISTHNLRLHDSRISRLARILLRLGSLIRRIRPDVVHCHALVPDALWVFLAMRLGGVQAKVVVTSHGDDIVRLPQWSYGRRQSRRSRFFAAQVTHWLSAHIVVSRAMVEYAVNVGTTKERIAVIPNGIPVGDDYDFELDTTSYPPVASEHDGVDIAAGDGIDILSLSSGRPIKNLDALVEAFAMARSDLGDSRLLLACDGPLSQPIVRLVEDKGMSSQVVFIGEVTGATKQSYFRNSDVYCLPSHFESFGLTLLEAMKFETAILASNVGGVSGFVEDKRNGLLVSPTDVPGMASALVRLYKDEELRCRLVENGSRTVQQYSISGIVEKHVSLYKRIVTERNAGP